MPIAPRRLVALALRLIVGLALLGWPRVGSAQGTWSAISLPQQPGQVAHPTAAAVDTAGNLYVACSDNGGRIQQQDAKGNWSVIAIEDTAIGQVRSPLALAADAAGKLYLAESDYDIGFRRLQKRDARGSWSLIDGPYGDPEGLTVDGAGSLYVADTGSNRVQMYTPGP